MNSEETQFVCFDRELKMCLEAGLEVTGRQDGEEAAGCAKCPGKELMFSGEPPSARHGADTFIHARAGHPVPALCR